MLLRSLFLSALFSSCVRATTVATPTIGPTNGTSYVQFSATVSDATSGSTIYYTLDGTTPTTSSSTVASGGAILISKTETLKAYAVESGYTDSVIASASYQVTGQLEAGIYHALALKSDGSVWAWGYNIYGQIGDGTTTQRNSAVLLTSTNLTGTIQVSAGQYHNLALRSDGTVWSWGLNTSGQLGDSTTTNRSSPVEVLKSNGSGGTTPLTNIVSIYAGGYHNLALDSTGHVWAWGQNNHGQLGDGTTTQQNLAEQLTLSGITVQELAAGFEHSLLLTTSGAVYAWGFNYYGQLGDNTTTDRYSPVAVSTLSGVTVSALTGGAEHSVALANDGTVWAWGENDGAQVGDGTTTSPRKIPVHLSSLTGMTSVTAGLNHTLAIKSDGTVWSWGTNSVGELGDGSSVTRSSPVQVTGVSNALFVTAGNESSYVLKSDGTVWVAGANNCGQLGDGTSVVNPVVLPLLGITQPIQQIATASNSYHTLALDRSGQVWSWGNNTWGMLGDGTNLSRVNAVPVTFSGIGSATITSLAVGANHSTALDSNGTLWSWGYALLGDGTTGNSSHPVHLTSPTGITTLGQGNSCMAIDGSGHIWDWGYNGYGELGDGTQVSPRTTPVEVLNYAGGTGTYLSNATAVAGGPDFSLAIVGGAVYSWGNNTSAQLGDGTITLRTSPVAVTGLSGRTIVAISAGTGFGLALDNTGHVWGWGNNGVCQLGDGTQINRGSAVEVHGPGGYLSNIIAIRCDSAGGKALDTSGNVWSWGYNAAGEVGNGTTTALIYGPVQTLNLSHAVAIGAGYRYGLALKEDGTLQSWGYNIDGDMGTQVNYATAFPISGFNSLATNLAPTVSIAGPANNATVTLGSTQPLTATASETGGAVASIKYYINSNLIGTSTVSPTYSVNWTPTTWGNFTFSSVATDTLGKTSYLSSPITVQVPYNSDGDSLPDWWEIKYFGNLGYGDSSSPDGNGFTLLQDYTAGADPTNYYSQPNGSGGALLVVPTLTLVSGNNQIGTPSAFLDQPLIVSVTNSSGGAALVNAPLTFAVVSGSGLVAANTTSTPGTTLPTTTNGSGQAQAFYQSSAGNNVTSSITASTAGQSTTFTSTTTSGDGTFDAPTSVITTSPGPTEIDISWVNHASTATGIIIEKSTDNVTWATIATLTNPAATSYAVTTGLTAGQSYYFGVAGTK